MNLKRLAKRALATLSLSMLCLIAFAQGHQISGTVIDGTGEPIIGANVLEVGTTNGVITDIDGNFKLSVQPNAKIQVSFIGYITQTVTVGSQKNIKVTLKEDAQALDEVVVVGYGVQKKSDVTGSVGSVNSDKIMLKVPLQLWNPCKVRLPVWTFLKVQAAPVKDLTSLSAVRVLWPVANLCTLSTEWFATT